MVACLVVGRAHSLLFLLSGTMSLVVAECACRSCIGLGESPPRGPSVTLRFVPVPLQFQVLALVVVAHLVCDPVRFFRGPAELGHASFGVFPGLNELIYFFESGAVSEVLVFGVFVY